MTPSVQQIDETTHFCFTIPQSKIIAFHLQQGKIDDDIIELQNQEISELFGLVKVKDSIIGELQLQEQYVSHALEIKEEQLVFQKHQLTKVKEKLQKRKKRTAIWGVALFVVTTLVVR